MNEGIKFRGVFTITCRDKDGNIKWEDKAFNTIVNEGLNYILDSALSGATQTTTWYIGLKNTGSPAAADTLATHAGWTENANYGGTRPQWTEGGAATQQITNSTAVDFTISSDSQTISGAFLCSVTSGTSGTLLSVANFTGGDKPCDTNDVLSVTYTITASS